jgi:kynureninase
MSHRDHADPLAHFREAFYIPRRPDGQPVIYFCGHSLGLQPRTARGLVERELDDWARLGVEAHFEGTRPWYSYHEIFRGGGARLVGARPGEVVMMNSLTVNLHLMLITFYRPRPGRDRILVDEPVFPSDLYAVKSQLQLHGRQPADAVVTVRPRPGEDIIRLEDLETLLERQGSQIALVLLSGVNYFSGQWFDVKAVTAAAHRHGCVAGFDLAHAAGNMPLQLHDWDVDFAVWCSYKYLNSGPGAVAGCFIHERHGHDLTLPRLAGWWGNDPATRFEMQRRTDFVPRPGADGWQISNPPILAMAPLRAALDLFDEAGMPQLRAKSEQLTGYLLELLDRLPPGRVEVLTPRDPAQHGCQVSLRVRAGLPEVRQALQAAGVVCDFREPDVIRVAPVPLYNTYQEVWAFAQALAALL